ncbi:TPA: hypothetical protein EYO12_01380 [Candidatus Saccharibacteria bacterium]|nr:hypothetical protein [Candidatus Saccharibacteria bacterium]HIO87367.1 hypothetical protein [Candidatus Saccharibacteria bacterium]
MSIFIHPKTRSNLASIQSNLPQVVIFAGSDGLGKRYAALEVIKFLENESAQQIESLNFERLLLVDTDDPSIGIGEIKDLEKIIKLSSNKKRYIIINEAEKMTTEAQNAFLKTLEESPPNTHTMLLAQNVNRLLPTVRSRSQIIDFYTASKDQFEEWLIRELGVERPQATKLYYETSCKPRLAYESLREDQGDDSIELAKKLLRSSQSQRLELIKPLAKDSAGLANTLNGLMTVVRSALQHAIRSDQPKEKIKQWKQRVELLLDLQNNHKKHVNTKLILSKLVINL